MMDGSRFDACIRTLAGSRRSLLGGSLALASGWLGVSTAAAKKKRKKRKLKKPKPNAFGCLEVGDPCKSAEQCCAGICEGKTGKKRCRAHDTGVCDQDAAGYCESASPLQTRCDNQANCSCTRTTAGSTICGTLSAPSDCADCKKDADCDALGFPPGSACIPFSAGNCAGTCASGMVCMAPCGAQLPAE